MNKTYVKKVVGIVVMFLASGFFLYSGFSELAKEETKNESSEINKSVSARDE